MIPLLNTIIVGGLGHQTHLKEQWWWRQEHLIKIYNQNYAFFLFFKLFIPLIQLELTTAITFKISSITF